MRVLTLNRPGELREWQGKEFGVTGWLELAQERINQFAEAAEDRQWIHVDCVRASRESPYGITIAHGFLTLSLIGYFVRRAIQIQSGVRFVVNYGLNRVRFPAPVRADSKIRGRVELLRFEDLPGYIQATFKVTIEIEGCDKPGCVAEWLLRYYS